MDPEKNSVLQDFSTVSETVTQAKTVMKILEGKKGGRVSIIEEVENSCLSPENS